MITAALQEILSGSSSITDLITVEDVPLIFHSAKDANSQDESCLVLQGEVATPITILFGTIQSYEGQYRIVCLAPDIMKVEELADAVTSLLQMNKGIYAGKTVSKLGLASRETLTRATLEGEALPRHGIALDFDYRIEN